MVLVTGAAGKTGKSVIRALAGAGLEVRALIHRKEYISSVKLAGAHEIIVGDLAELSVLKDGVLGAKAVYHICPNVSPKEVEYGQTIIEAAKWVGVDRFVYHSVLHPQIEAMPHHWAKMRVEEMIFESGLPFTILQPAAYMQNLLGYREAIRNGSLPLPYSAEARLSMVDLQDVADAAAIVLSEPNHDGATYELVGPGRYSQAEIAELLTEMLNIPVRIDQIPLDRWERLALSKGLSRYQIDTLMAMFDYYDRHNFLGNDMVLGWLLGREVTTFKAFLERNLTV